jgi:NAD(P)-dependent dehydrogenase (short-subunit alcohol dehydrogenase family)
VVVADDGPRCDGARVLLTGGTSGLGLAMARALVAGGATVAITGRYQQRTDAVAAALTEAGDRPAAVVAIAMDVRDEAVVAAGVRRAVEALGAIDVLVLNAGIGMRTVNPRFMTEPQPFWQVTPEGFDDLVATNLAGYFLVARAVVPLMLEQGHGRIVAISMNHSTMNRKGFVPYGPARAGAEALTRIMAADLAGSGVTVNLLLPGGATRTGMLPDEITDDVRSRLIDPDVMAKPIRWLCSTQAQGLHDERIVATEFDRWLHDRSRLS